jgi:hypothetical protein
VRFSTNLILSWTVIGCRKDMSELTIMMEKDDMRKVWNYILPKQHKSTSYHPIQSIPLLTKQNCSKNRLKKGKIRNL